MNLSKHISARTRTVVFKWIKKDFKKCDESYMAIRNGLHGRRRGTMVSCDWCKRKFEEDEPFALAHTLKKESPNRNWCLCHNCADRALNST